MGVRLEIDKFTAAFAKKDEILCGIAARTLVDTVNWTDQPRFLEDMPQDEFDLRPWWIFHCIGKQIFWTMLCG
jgi:hypothetical protein